MADLILNTLMGVTIYVICLILWNIERRLIEVEKKEKDRGDGCPGDGKT